MKQKFSLCYFILVITVACNNTAKQNIPADTLTQANNITQASPDLEYKIDTSKQVTNNLLQKRDTLLRVDLNNNNKGSVSGYLTGIGKHVTIVIPVNGGDSLTAELIAEDTANIRINQIYIPAGKTGKYDGPFTRKISYPITVKGDYRLIVGENLMAEGDWEGNFTCKIAIK